MSPAAAITAFSGEGAMVGEAGIDGCDDPFGGDVGMLEHAAARNTKAAEAARTLTGV